MSCRGGEGCDGRGELAIPEGVTAQRAVNASGYSSSE